MIHALLKAASVLALGSLAWMGLAQAAAPLPMTSTAPLVILAADEENEEVWQDLRPDVTPPEAAVGEGEAPKGSMQEPPREEGSGNAEEKALREDGLDGE
jgi:hypothetical protein